MNELSTIQELCRHLDWAGERVLTLAEGLNDEALDRPVEMGPGSLRKTLWHVDNAEHLWLGRIAGEQSPTHIFRPDERQPLRELRDIRVENRAARQRLFESIKDDGGLVRAISYRDLRGNPQVSKLGDILLQVSNHAIHHRAQAVNMLRIAGVTRAPRIDYIFMRYEQPDPAVRLSTATLRTYFAYTDWAEDRVLTAAMPLGDAQLDQPFEMGTGSLRQTLVHMHDAERWWYHNWTRGPDAAFPTEKQTVAVGELWAQIRQQRARRNEYLSGQTDDDLLREMRAQPAPGRFVAYPLGQTMLQLCGHGTHHRAQAINMLRRLGQAVPSTDYIAKTREMPG